MHGGNRIDKVVIIQAFKQVYRPRYTQILLSYHGEEESEPKPCVD